MATEDVLREVVRLQELVDATLVPLDQAITRSRPGAVDHSALKRAFDGAMRELLTSALERGERFQAASCCYGMVRMRDFAFEPFYGDIVLIGGSTIAESAEETVPRDQAVQEVMSGKRVDRILLIAQEESPTPAVEDVFELKIPETLAGYFLDKSTSQVSAAELGKRSPSFYNALRSFVTMYVQKSDPTEAATEITRLVERVATVMAARYRAYRKHEFPAKYHYFLQGLRMLPIDRRVAGGTQLAPSETVDWLFVFGFDIPLDTHAVLLLRILCQLISARMSFVALSMRQWTASRSQDETYADRHGRVIWERLVEARQQGKLVPDDANVAVFRHVESFFARAGLVWGERPRLLEILSVVTKVGEVLGIAGFKSYEPHELSARAVAAHPPVQALYHALDFEGTLRGVPDYRQHFEHSFEVFLLGYYLLQHIHERLSGRTLRKLTYLQGLTIWFLASIFHDIGYPITAADKMINSYLMDMLVDRPTELKEKPRAEDEGRAKFDPKDVRLVTGNELARLLLFKEYQYLTTSVLYGFVHAFDASVDHGGDHFEGKRNLERQILYWLVNKQDHGVCSAIMFLQACLLGETKRTFDPNKPLAGRELLACAADSILFHDQYWRTRGKVPADRNPFAFLLMFCDLAQQEGRTPETNYRNQYRTRLKDVSVNRVHMEDGAVELQVSVVLGYSERKADQNGAQEFGDEVLDGHRWETFFKDQIKPYGAHWQRPAGFSFKVEYESEKERKKLPVVTDYQEITFG